MSGTAVRGTSGEQGSPALDTDPASLDWAGDDWGHLTHHRPRGVLRPRHVTDIAVAARFASDRRLGFVPRGQGHSVAGQAQTHGGIVVDMSRLDTVHDVRADRVIVDAGARWSQVLRATLPRGLVPPVLTDYLEMSVGGTLAAGGIGGATQHHGFQTDNVDELEVVTPKGEVRTCSRTRNVELFDAVRSGFGGSGVIVRATLRLVAAEPHVRRYQLCYDDLVEFVRDQRRLIVEGRFDHVKGLAKPSGNGWTYVLEAALFHTADIAHADRRVLADLSYQRGTEVIEEIDHFGFLDRMAPEEAFLRSAEAEYAWYRPHPWINVFLPDSATVDVVGDAMDELTSDDIGDTGLVLLYPFHTGRAATPGLSLPDEPITFLFALLRTAAPDDGTIVQRMLSGNRALRRRALHAGGSVYLDSVR